MKKFYLTLLISFIYLNLFAQEEPKPEFEIAGQIMTDMGYNFNQINPDYFDVMRPTQLPAFKNQYGSDGNVFFSARQSFLDFRSNIPTRLGNLSLRFAFDLFGTGTDVGRTTFHMIFAYAELGMIGFGHNWSLFSDIEGYPNAIEYWGPSGLALCKNVQLRFIPLKGANRLAFALEGPGASADQGKYRDRIELQDVEPKFNLPDLSAEFRMTRKWGYAELAGILRKIEWVDQGQLPLDLSGNAVGWGLNLSTNLKIGKNDLFLGQVVVGEGIENNMNDAPTDIAIKDNPGNPNTPFKGVPLPVFSYSAYLNHRWNERLTSIIGFSSVIIDNTDGQEANAYHLGRYASTNLLYTPIPNLTAGVELQWINRDNFDDGWTTSATKIQVSFKYYFRHVFNKSKD
ncbi:DcaP family trimeric outer membrane transporter [Solitalea sp. MAHUQ-68]|uniref:DcaP family trimeric outer membrane transporter n=1 Tax=Solitalea agri TaxID=2953739 RepID=A0A9X2F9Q4_9SPHI|nr:DcaP family trimeric outer membrane transporter [Solitalea agri]MCO4294423.1 DcaP family trimeric outer membrane transporter [Solitalea agri]